MVDHLRLLMGGDYDRIRLLTHPHVRETFGLAVEVVEHPLPHDVFRELTHGVDGDGGELSLSFLSTLVSAPTQTALVALPVFVSRMFRHGNVLVRDGAEIDDPSDLRGRLVGVPEYGATMAVWVRGLLRDDYGVRPGELRWRASRMPVALGSDELRLPEGVDIATAPGDLIESLCAGQLDAVVGVAPAPLPDGVRRLFPDYGAVERDYFRRTGIFPIMHALALRQSVVERVPDLPARLYAAAVWARDEAIRTLRRTAVLGATMPWLLPAIEEQLQVFGGELWPYGVARNQVTLEAFLDYAWDDGLLWRRLSPGELFVDVDDRGVS